jgi:hypothetical protein
MNFFLDDLSKKNVNLGIRERPQMTEPIRKSFSTLSKSGNDMTKRILFYTKAPLTTRREKLGKMRFGDEQFEW